MAGRTTTDVVQLELKIGGEKAGSTLKELNAASKSLNKEIQNLTPGTEEFKKKAEELRLVNARINGIKQEIKGVSDEMKKAGSGFKQFSGGVQESISSLIPLGPAAVAAFAVDKIIEFGKGAWAAFGEAENAAFQLRNAIVTLGGESEETFDRLLHQSDELEATTFGFTAENIQNAQKMLKVYGANGEEIEALIPKILDYATVTEQDLGSATNDIIAGFQGKTKALEKAGLQFEKGKISTLAMSEALDKFKGSATEALDVGTNKTEIFSDMWGKVEETVGGFLADIGLRLLDWVFQLGSFFVGLYNDIAPTVTSIYNFFSGIVDRFPILNRLYNVLLNVFSPLTSVPKILQSAAAGVSAFITTASEKWNTLKELTLGVFRDIGKIIKTAFTDPLNLGSVITDIKTKFTNVATDLGDTFGKNYEAALKKYTFTGITTEVHKAQELTKGRTFKNEEEITSKHAEEAEKRVAKTKETVEKVINEEKKIVEAKEIDYQKLAQQQNDANQKLLEGADLEEDLANRVMKAKADIAILEAKNDEELLQAKIQKIITERDIELQSLELTVDEKKLIKAKANDEILQLEQAHTDKLKELKDQETKDTKEALQQQKDDRKAMQDAVVSIANSGLQALLQFSQMETDQKVAGYEKDKDTRIKSLDEQLRKGTISEKKYAKSKEAIERDTHDKIADIKTKQAKKDKAAAILQAGINTAVAITAGMASPAIPPFPSAIAAGVIGAIQIALITAKPLPTFAKGGIAYGASHNQGGIKMIDSLSGNMVGEMEGNEPYMILSKMTYANNRNVIDKLLYNSIHRNGAPIFEKGGIFSAPVTSIKTTSTGNTSADVISSALLTEISGLRNDVQSLSGRLKAEIVYQDIEDANTQINAIRGKAGR